MRVHVLLLAHDEVVLRMVQRIFRDVQAELQSFHDSATAALALAQQRFDLLMIDCDDTFGAVAVLKSASKSSTNRASTVLAIVNGATHPADAADMGATRVTSKPLNFDTTRAMIRELLPLLSGEQRKYPRFSVNIPIYVTTGEAIDRRATTFNLSEGGLGLQLPQPIREDDFVRVKFELPGTGVVIRARAEIAWADPQGRAGLRFSSMEDSARCALRQWLNRQALGVELPRFSAPRQPGLAPQPRD